MPNSLFFSYIFGEPVTCISSNGFSTGLLAICFFYIYICIQCVYLTIIIPQARIGYEMIDSQRGA